VAPSPHTSRRGQPTGEPTHPFEKLASSVAAAFRLLPISWPFAHSTEHIMAELFGKARLSITREDTGRKTSVTLNPKNFGGREDGDAHENDGQYWLEDARYVARLTAFDEFEYQVTWEAEAYGNTVRRNVLTAVPLDPGIKIEVIDNSLEFYGSQVRNE
jgi:hypothetical protein